MFINNYHNYQIPYLDFFLNRENHILLLKKKKKKKEDVLLLLYTLLCKPGPNDSRSFEVGLPINLFWVGNEFPTMVKSLWGQPNVDTMEESPPKFCYVLETIYIASSQGITFFILLLEIWVWSLYSFLSLCCMS